MSILISHNYRVNSVAWSKDGTLASDSYDSTVKVWVMDSSNKLKLQSTLSGHKYAPPPGHFTKFQIVSKNGVC